MPARSVALSGIGLFGIWTVATYMLEGRIETLLRPESTLDRLLYVVIANILVGTVAALLWLRHQHLAGAISLRHAGFRSFARSLGLGLGGAVIGLLLYLVQGPPTLNPIVLINGFAQVLSVSVAEVLICWVVVGVAVESLMAGAGRVAVGVAMLATSSVLFGLYHFAHSAPFNTVPMVTLLAVIGLGTGLFFVVSRDVYGTIAFHNFLGVLGVLRALDEAGQLDTYARLQPPLLIMSVLSLGSLVALHALWLKTDHHEQKRTATPS